MTEKTITAAKVREYFTVDNIEEEIERIYEVLQKSLTFEECANILVNCVQAASAEEIANLTLYEKSCFIAREAFLEGYLKATEIYLKAAQMSYEELLG